MSDQELDKRFREAFEIASQMSQADLPQDTQLRLYAYYKQGSQTQPSMNVNTGIDLRNAFKTNAWMQISNMNPEEAKQLYVELVDSLQQR
ncbi:acyl-CoA-binding protein [Flavobacterium selenitireducens]|uniref:acyl-CoA-binding protein n=1 Tax=Flavobacterium selenitireducens TaxID=2722704 RepID=UPI00168B1A47|nr:acyl-CoA-binding protein [Flavobacterium selenitireducens]MBD3583789.1 acyl-CoA-binding protein [Flavobacterium selenitireducens]